MPHSHLRRESHGSHASTDECRTTLTALNFERMAIYPIVRRLCLVFLSSGRSARETLASGWVPDGPCNPSIGRLLQRVLQRVLHISRASHLPVSQYLRTAQLAGVNLVLVTATVRAEKHMHDPCDCAKPSCAVGYSFESDTHEGLIIDPFASTPRLACNRKTSPWHRRLDPVLGTRPIRRQGGFP